MDTTFNSSGERTKNVLKDDVRAVKNSATDEFKTFVSDIEEAVKRVADVSNADVVKFRSKIQSAISSAKDGAASGVVDLKELKRQGRQIAKQTDTYVRARPWQTIGLIAAFVALVGISGGYFAARR